MKIGGWNVATWVTIVVAKFALWAKESEKQTAESEIVRISKDLVPPMSDKPCEIWFVYPQLEKIEANPIKLVGRIQEFGCKTRSPWSK